MELTKLVSKEKDVKNQKKSLEIINKLKADYFLQKVFNNLEIKRTLNMVKYNKKLKKRINIKDYKEYSEKYSSIEIEIKPVNNECVNFINIKNEEQEYYH